MIRQLDRSQKPGLTCCLKNVKLQAGVGMSLLLFIVLTSCSQENNGIAKLAALGNSRQPGDSVAKTIAARFSTPPGYERKIYAKNSFAYYLSNFPLKPAGAKVYYFNGALKPNTSVYASVLDIDVGNKDLQQCADAVIRLRAEYLYGQKRYDEIHFNFTNGFRADYLKWAEGSRIKVSGNNTSWFKAKEKDYSYKCFREYLDIVFSYAGTRSLNNELYKASAGNIEPGDVFIKGGSPGHAVIVVDVSVNKTNGKRIFMIAQSYMPAQSVHLLVNENNKILSPWYDLSESDKLYTPEWTFEKSDLKRFDK